MAKGDSDRAAVELWGDAFSAIPKSAFAVAAWYLADICSGAGAGNGEAYARFDEEIAALVSNGIIDKAQGARVRKAISRVSP